MPRGRALTLAVALAGVAGCAGAGSTPPAPPASSSPSAALPPGPVQRVTKVLVVIEENHSYDEMRSGMPFLAGLADRFGYATGYRAIAHPSLPNYLAIAGGSTFGVSDDASPSAHPLTGASVFGEAVAAGKTARLYAESMPVACDTQPASPYAVKHAPWAYFVDERSECLTGMVAAGTPRGGHLIDDVRAGSLPTVGMLIPDLADDAHDGSLSAADTWLQGWLAPVLAGPDFTGGRLAIVITADEDDYSADNRVLTVVVAPGVSHRVVTTALTHYSLTRFLDEVAGVALLRNAAGATSLGSAFGLG